MIRFYFATSYMERERIAEYATRVRALGYEVTSRWLGLQHDEVADRVEAAIEGIAAGDGEGFALTDLIDIERADTIVCFTFPSQGGPSRGGRHFEAGWALRAGKDMIVVGPRENVFYDLSAEALAVLGVDASITQFDSFGQFVDAMEVGAQIPVG